MGKRQDTWKLLQLCCSIVSDFVDRQLFGHEPFTNKAVWGQGPLPPWHSLIPSLQHNAQQSTPGSDGWPLPVTVAAASLGAATRRHPASHTRQVQWQCRPDPAKPPLRHPRVPRMAWCSSQSSGHSGGCGRLCAGQSFTFLYRCPTEGNHGSSAIVRLKHAIRGVQGQPGCSKQAGGGEVTCKQWGTQERPIK